MNQTPLFQIASEPDQKENSVNGAAELIEVDKALESMRDAGFDLTAAAGEPIDNSIEANATQIRIETTFAQSGKKIDAIAFADNGRGIPLEILPNVLRMGYSSRYNERKGLGRFGVGLKLAGLSHARRLEVYTKPAGSEQISVSYLDLDLIAQKQQRFIEAVEAEDWPAEYRKLMQGKSGEPFERGTLIVWRNIDRLSSGGKYASALRERVDELRKFIARAYRTFLDRGLQIELNGTSITLHDPLFLMDNPRITKRYKDVKGRIIDEGTIPIDGGHEIHVRVTVVPEIFRPREGAGGDEDADGKDIREFQINREVEGKLSMLRNGREIYYEIVPRLLPSGVDKIDRYIGIEVSFPAELDEYFQVRHVKRGAEPVSKLRESLREWLARPVKAARKEIRAYWGQVKDREHQEAGEHGVVLDAVERAERESPRGQAGLGVPQNDQDKIVDDLVGDYIPEDEQTPEAVREFRKSIEARPMMLFDGSWPGKELFEITHLNGKAIIRINHRHPFIREIYDPVKRLAIDQIQDLTASNIAELARKVGMGFDVLFLAYAKAENLHTDPSKFDDLRSYWGQHAQAYLKELLPKE